MANEHASMHASMGGVRCLSWCHIVGLKCSLLLTSMSVIGGPAGCGGAGGPALVACGPAALVRTDYGLGPLPDGRTFGSVPFDPFLVEP